MEKLNINGIALAYQRHGQGTPLVLIHGYPLDHSIWNEVVPLLENDFDVILPDLRGFGESSTVTTPYTIKDMASDLATLLDHLEMKQAVLAGHSMGGYVALAFARRYPQRVSALGLVASQAAADPADRREGRYKTASDVSEKGVGIVAEAMTPKMSADSRVQNYVKKLIEKQCPDGIIGALKAMAEREDMEPYLSEFKFPILLLHGDADLLIPVDRARDIKTALPHAQIIEMTGVGHLPMMESAGQVATSLKVLK